MSFELLSTEIENGISGKNNGIPMGFKKLNRYIGIRKRILTSLFGAPGSGKSAYLHSAYILNPVDWYLREKPKDTKLTIKLFSMERSKVYILAKWLSRKIFIEEGELIPLQKMLGWWDTKLTKDEHDLVLSYKDYINELLTIVEVIEGAQNPTGIYKKIKEYAKSNGKFEDVDEYHKIYIPTHPNEILIIGEDHLGLTKMESNMKTKKEAIDKLSEYNQWFRDALGATPVTVSQITRNLSNPIYHKMDSFEPTLDDLKESGRPAEDADVVISLFDPIRYKTTDSSYKAENMVDPSTGAKYFRSIKVLKNTYGEDDIKIGMAFQGATGIFKELPKSKDMDNFDYDNMLFKWKYFAIND